MKFNSQTKRAQLAHVANLISMARFDGQMTENETDYILMVAKTFNLSQEELDQCMEDSDNLVIVTPQSEEEKLEYLTNLFTMVFTESTIDKRKRAFAKRICEKYGCDIRDVYKNIQKEGIVDEELIDEALRSDPEEQYRRVKEFGERFRALQRRPR